jgi:hypothetical protein
MNHVLNWMLKNGPLSQSAYLNLAYLGEKDSIEQLEGEELAELPEGFEDWPVYESPVN